MTCFICLLIACDRPECENTNPVLAKFSPYANEYKAELIQQLNTTDRKKVTYWIKRFVPHDNRLYLQVYVQTEGLCAEAVLDITDSDRFKSKKEIQRPGGYGYCGAELIGLKYRIDSSANGYNFIFESVEKVVD